MNNYQFKNNVKIVIVGKNINNFILRMIKYKINIIKQYSISYKETHLIISYEDYLKLLNYKTTYNIKIIKKYGLLRIKEIVKTNIIIFISLIISIFFLFILSNIIFDIEIIHHNTNIINLVDKELKKHNIVKYHFAKSYKKLEVIEDEILKNNKDTLEWIEIIPNGTKYIVRVEERLLNQNEDNTKYQHIVASKSAIIKSIYAYNGEKIKNVNDYVKKDDIVISGTINLTNGSVYNTKAIGKIYGEVWYTIKTEYPLVYYEEILTGRSRELYVFDFWSNKISLFNFKKYESFNYLSNTIFSNNLIPISFKKEKQYEVKVIEEIYTEEEVSKKAIEHGKNKLLLSNNKIQNIKNITILEKEYTASKVIITIFVSVIEDISKIQEFNIDITN